MAGENGILGLYDWSTGEELARRTGHTGAVKAVAATFEQAWVVTAGADGTLRLWDASRRRFERVLWTGSGELASCAAAPGSVRVAAVSVTPPG